MVSEGLGAVELVVDVLGVEVEVAVGGALVGLCEAVEGLLTLVEACDVVGRLVIEAEVT